MACSSQHLEWYGKLNLLFLEGWIKDQKELSVNSVHLLIGILVSRFKKQNLFMIYDFRILMMILILRKNSTALATLLFWPPFTFRVLSHHSLLLIKLSWNFIIFVFYRSVYYLDTKISHEAVIMQLTPSKRM